MYFHLYKQWNNVFFMFSKYLLILMNYFIIMIMIL